MNERAQIIKTAMEQELIKEGRTLADLELALSKEAGGSSLLIDPSKAWDIVKGLASGTGAAALTIAGLGGTGLYAGYLANENSNNLQLKKMKERQQYMDATKSLKEDMQSPLTL